MFQDTKILKKCGSTENAGVNIVYHRLHLMFSTRCVCSDRRQSGELSTAFRHERMVYWRMSSSSQ